MNLATLIAGWMVAAAMSGCGSRTAAEMRAFPEEVHRTSQAKGSGATVETVVGANRADRVYQTALSYPDAVGFFDRTLASAGFRSPARTSAQTTTVWSVRYANGQPARVPVRNTSPTTVEVVTSEKATAESAPLSATNTQPGPGTT